MVRPTRHRRRHRHEEERRAVPKGEPLRGHERGAEGADDAFVDRIAVPRACNQPLQRLLLPGAIRRRAGPRRRASLAARIARASSTSASSPARSFDRVFVVFAIDSGSSFTSTLSIAARRLRRADRAIAVSQVLLLCSPRSTYRRQVFLLTPWVEYWLHTGAFRGAGDPAGARRCRLGRSNQRMITCS